MRRLVARSRRYIAERHAMTPAELGGCCGGHLVGADVNFELCLLTLKSDFSNLGDGRR